MNTITAAITAVGSYVPEYVLSNKILETMVDTNDEWITSRTGIKERRILKDKDKGTSYLAIKQQKTFFEKAIQIPLKLIWLSWQRQHQICPLLLQEFM